MRARPKRALHALASTHGVADSGPPLSASSSSFGRPNQRRDRAIRAISAPRDSLVVFSTPWRTSGPPDPSFSPSLAPMATGAADGRLGRANAGRYERVERELDGVKASVAHRDFNGARSGSGEARSRSGHGEAPTVALWPDLERSDSVEGYDGLELALGGSNGGWVQGGAAGTLGWLGKGARKANLVAAARSSASGAREGNERIVRWRGFYRERRRRCASTSPGTQAGKQLRALTHAHGTARAAAALDRGAVIPIGSL